MRHDMEEKEKFHARLKQLIHQYVRRVYQLTKKFPKDELYGVTSQFRRATVSVMLNYMEGFARRRRAVKLNFFEIAYGSLKESKYLLFLSLEEGYIMRGEFEGVNKLSEEIAAMLWRTIEGINRES